MTRRPRRRATPLVALLALGGCAMQGLSFRVDDRVDLREPADREEIALPYTFRWDVHDVEPTGGSGRFALFLDRTPMAPGRSADSLLSDEQEARCAGDPACTAEALAADGVWLTDDTELTVDSVAADPDDRPSDLHRMTLVLLDEDGRRRGESAFSVEFRLEEQD
jgi:hypothetical protein